MDCCDEHSAYGVLIQGAVVEGVGRVIARADHEIAVITERHQQSEAVPVGGGPQPRGRNLPQVSQVSCGRHLAKTPKQGGRPVEAQTVPAGMAVVADAGELGVLEDDLHQRPQNPFPCTYCFHAILPIKLGKVSCTYWVNET